MSIFEYDEEEEMKLIRKQEREAAREELLALSKKELLALFQEEGLAVDIEDGLAAGMEQGADNFAALTAKLLADSRTEDLMRATTDKEFRDMLYQEYGILNK